MASLTSLIEDKWNTLQNNKNLQIMLEDYPEITKEVLHNIAEFLVYRNNEGYITDNHINDIYNDEEFMNELAQKGGYPLYNEDGTPYISPNKGIPSRYLYIYMVYIFKFDASDAFWHNNIRHFLPRHDNEEIEEREKLKLLFEAIGIEFDKLEELINKMAELQNIDEVPNEYLEYLAQLLGYEKEDFRLGDTSFREIVKNIIEIYKIKGTNYSFKFFFKFLGFDYDVYELYFDRDRDKAGEANNKASNYLTEIDPRERFEVDSITGEVILWPIKPEDFTETRNLELFDVLADPAGRNIPVDVLLGKVGDFPQPFTYFKTNMIRHELRQYFQGDVELVPHDPDIVDKIINKYIRFLTPSYIQSSININMTPYMDGPIPVFEKFTILLTKEIMDILGFNTTEGEWEQLKTEYETVDTENDDKIFDIHDYEVHSVSVNTEGYPLNLEEDKIGSYILHNGAVLSRSPELPGYIQGLTHSLTFKTALESVRINVGHPNWDYTLDSTSYNEFLRTHDFPWQVSKEYEAEAGQTAFKIPYIYDSTIINVYVNNVLTESFIIDGSFIILNSPANAGDIVKVVSDKG